jgi:hypothetical protein
MKTCYDATKQCLERITSDWSQTNPSSCS